MAWDLCQTPQVSRLRDISLACTPSRFVPHGQAANRFQHSVGASVLARRLSEQEEELRGYRQLLVAACLLHDSGSPPFSHVAEPFLYQKTGQHHEQAVGEILKDQNLQSILASYDISPEAVSETISGRGPVGDLIAGSIDLDNIDNSLHLLISLGYQGKLPYSPKRLLEYIHYTDGEAWIELTDQSMSQLLGWRAARRELYDRLGSLVYLASTSMLYRSLELADLQEVIGEEFFSLGENEALIRIQESGEGPNRLLSDLAHWRQYPCLLFQASEQEDPRLSPLYGDVDGRRKAADQVADSLSLQPHQVCLYVGKEKGHRAIELPMRGELQEAAKQTFSAGNARQKVALFVDKQAAVTSNEAEQAFKDLLQDLPEGEPSHCFF